MSVMKFCYCNARIGRRNEEVSVSVGLYFSQLNPSQFSLGRLEPSRAEKEMNLRETDLSPHGAAVLFVQDSLFPQLT